MQKKLKLTKLMIVGIAVVLSIIIVATLFGRNSTQPVYLVKSDEIDLNKELDKQLPMLSEVEILESEFKYFGKTVVTSQDQLRGKKLKYKLRKGSVIPLDALTSSTTAGQFASHLPVNHAVFMIPGGVSMLPPGITKGDRIDVAVESEREKGDPITGVLSRNIEVYDINEGTIYLKVKQKEYLQMSLAQKIGKFVLYLPGQKNVESCEQVRETLAETVETTLERDVASLKKKLKKAKTQQKITTLSTQIKETEELKAYMEEQELTTNEYLQEKMEQMDCAGEGDAIQNITKEEILDIITTKQTEEDADSDFNDLQKQENEYGVEEDVTGEDEYEEFTIEDFEESERVTF